MFRKICIPFVVLVVIILMSIGIQTVSALTVMKVDGNYRIDDPVTAYSSWLQGNLDPLVCSNDCLNKPRCLACTYIYLPGWPSGTCYLYDTQSYQKDTNLMAGSTYVTYLKKEVNTAPTAYFTASPASGPVPLTVQFDASISSDPEGSISGYAWNFGDNTQGQGVMVTHVYQTAGTYTVTLTVTDKGSMKGTTTRQITGGVQEVITNTPPIANFAADKYSGTVPLTVAFDASSSYDSDGTIASYSWDFGDGTTGSGVMSSHVYTSPNIYRVSMSVTDNKGASSSTWKSIDAKSGTSGENSQNILTKGKISISSQPSGAQVYVDNIVKGKTPCLIEDVSAGKHTISVEMQGYTPWSMEVDVNSGSTLTLSANLNALVTTAPPTPTKGPLNILSVLGALYAVSIIFVLRWRKP